MKTQLNILLGGLGLFTLQGCKAPQAEQSVQPNVIYVFPDQYRNQAMEFWGQEGFREKVNFRNDPVHTPRLNDFARESVVLTSAMSNCPLSSPHRGSLLTGMYPNKSGIPLNCNSSRPISSLREDAVCVSDVFCNAGYDCAYFGKLHADFPTPNDPERPGQYVEDRVPAWDAYTPKERRHGFNYWYSYGTFDELGYGRPSPRPARVVTVTRIGQGGVLSEERGECTRPEETFLHYGRHESSP